MVWYKKKHLILLLELSRMNTEIHFVWKKMYN